ncbi:MAG: hypothetical protein P4L63_03375 [Candidatus Pacebacteria bacterium]|nr:hypothetical protein [Candidatus Paceibacterota bacterium]
MMYFLLILFFGSLLGITFMIGRKLVMFPDGQGLHKNATTKDSYLEEWKYIIIKNGKKYGYLGLVASVRAYVHFVSFLKRKYTTVKMKLSQVLDKKFKKGSVQKREVSGFLKMISEYKYKIRKIRHQIKEEEDL